MRFNQRPQPHFSSTRDDRRDSNSDWAPNQQYNLSSNNRFNSEFANQQEQVHSAKWYEEKVNEGLRESLRVAAETNEIGQRTAEQLVGQTEQLQRISTEVDDVSHNLDTSQYLIKGMKSWFGSVVQMFTQPPAAAPARGATESSSSSSSSSSSCAKSCNDDQRFHAPVSSRSLPTTSNANHVDRNARSALSSDLDTLSGMLDEMKAKAVGMGEEIGVQNVLLEDIHQGVERNSDRMTAQKHDINKLLKRV